MFYYKMDMHMDAIPYAKLNGSSMPSNVYIRSHNNYICTFSHCYERRDAFSMFFLYWVLVHNADKYKKLCCEYPRAFLDELDFWNVSDSGSTPKAVHLNGWSDDPSGHLCSGTSVHKPHKWRVVSQCESLLCEQRHWRFL